MRTALLSLALMVVPFVAAQAPIPQSPVTDRPPKTPAVAYLFPEQVTVVADKPTPVDLHFKVGDGLHINSHIPRTEDLIPTTLKFTDTADVRLSKADFPPGADFAFGAATGAPAEKLSVYTGEFIIHAELIAAKGNHLVEATLRYQACTNNICLPPHNIPVAIDVISK
jgi:hypothetical protein